ncbi:hypothetical protein [Ferruginibacter sp. HRS2-29]|uniref:HD domain-containing protein n=1 Tax=Ferruginibacter sp. HRS2-29 TaxID=2487334 RepID=UPI0020CEAC6B|nr:hypothetical protein [Ferruginibacter sp. HRS2-29]MCP9749821.1 hypothetical protein [Ferruginibacter sp. HRS2-29]
MELKETFLHLVGRYAAGSDVAATLWQQIEKQYSAKKRHYHNFAHLENLLKELVEIRQGVEDWDAVLFTIFYHDIVYNPLRRDNEDKSAAMAVKVMQSLQVPEPVVLHCREMILATKKHQHSPDNDTNLFTDADLCILGSEPEEYKAYSLAVRKEYTGFPDLLYKPGRKKVLQNFLQMEQIFKTPHFFSLYEKQARKNIQEELRNKK